MQTHKNDSNRSSSARGADSRSSSHASGADNQKSGQAKKMEAGSKSGQASAGTKQADAPSNR